MVQLVRQVNWLNLPGNTTSGPLMVTFHGSTTKESWIQNMSQQCIICSYLISSCRCKLTAEQKSQAVNFRLRCWQINVTLIETGIRGEQGVEVKSEIVLKEPHIFTQSHFLSIFIPDNVWRILVASGCRILATQTERLVERWDDVWRTDSHRDWVCYTRSKGKKKDFSSFTFGRLKEINNVLHSSK